MYRRTWVVCPFEWPRNEFQGLKQGLAVDDAPWIGRVVAARFLF
jgi:hypothetical protein